MIFSVSTIVLLTAIFFVNISAHNHKLDTSWDSFKKMFEKKYPTTQETHRRYLWESNIDNINRHNLDYNMQKHSYSMGINEYSDMDHEEFCKKMLGLKQSYSPSSGKKTMFQPNLNNMKLPSTVDWRDHGLVTAVKNQKECGACYAFSATGSLEGQVKRKTGKLISLSEQNIVDCSSPEGNEGCDGGRMENTFNYIQKNNGIDAEASYPYIAKAVRCRYDPSNNVTTVRKFAKIPPGNETALKAAVGAIGPISVAIHGSSKSFQFYSGGIYNDPDCTSKKLDHAVVAVGYGTEDGVDYWLIKNSWGTSWGLKGYMKIARKNNICGIASDAVFPII